MNKTMVVAKYEYMHHVAKKRFWLTLLLLPLGFAILILLSMLLSRSSYDFRPIGLVDKADIISLEPDNSAKSTFFNPQIYLHTFPDEAAAKKAVETGEIQGFAVIPEGYLASYQLDYWTNKQPAGEVQSKIVGFISQNLLAAEKADPVILERLSNGNQISLESLDGKTKSDGTGWHRIFVPIIVGILNLIVVMYSGGYLLQALVEEKENRTMEILLTSVPPREMMTGKIIGNLSVGLTQIAAWALILFAGLTVFSDKLGFLADIELSGSYLAVSLALLLISFIFTAALMATIGATMTSIQESQSVTGLIVLPMMLPFYFINVFISNPNGVVARLLSYIPLSAPLALSMRMAFTSVPAIEIAFVFALLIGLTVLMIWLASVAFKRGMLQYSQKLSLRSLLKKEVNHA